MPPEDDDVPEHNKSKTDKGQSEHSDVDDEEGVGYCLTGMRVLNGRLYTCFIFPVGTSGAVKHPVGRIGGRFSMCRVLLARSRRREHGLVDVHVQLTQKV
jgi:hypothetical protein